MRPRTLRECMEGGSYCNSGPPRKQKERQYFWRVPLLAHANTGIQDRRERRCRPWKRRWATRQGSQRTEQGLECSRSSLVKLSNRSPVDESSERLGLVHYQSNMVNTHACCLCCAIVSTFFGGVVLVIPLCQAKTTCVFKEMQEHPDSLHNVSSSFL